MAIKKEKSVDCNQERRAVWDSRRLRSHRGSESRTDMARLRMAGTAIRTPVAYRFYIVYRQSPSGPVNPSFRALSGRLEFTVRRHKFNQDSLTSSHSLLPSLRNHFT